MNIANYLQLRKNVSWWQWYEPARPQDFMVSLGHKHPTEFLNAHSRCSLTAGRGSSCLLANKVSLCQVRGPWWPLLCLAPTARAASVGKALAAASPSGGCICQPILSFWKEKPPPGRKLRQARHKSKLFQLSTQITIERLNMNKCCRFIYNASFYLWNVSEWSKDTKRLLETLVKLERQPPP